MAGISPEHQTKSGEYIRQWLQDKINDLPEVKENHAMIEVPWPNWHEADVDGCNWNIEHWANANPYESAIRRILAEARLRFRIEDDD
jgi:hypothetical protein